jgi:Ca-activated chloride channel family protein
LIVKHADRAARDRRNGGQAFLAASSEFRFATAVAAFGMILRDSPNKGDSDLGRVLEWARTSVGEDEGGLRGEFLQLVERARSLQPR